MTPTNDRHRSPALTIRPDADLQKRTKTTLDQHDWNMTEFIAACMELVNRNPDAMLTSLAEFKPPRVRGRPRRTEPDTDSRDEP